MPKSAKKTVLIVEDEPEFAAMEGEILARAGYRVETLSLIHI